MDALNFVVLGAVDGGKPDYGVVEVLGTVQMGQSSLRHKFGTGVIREAGREFTLLVFVNIAAQLQGRGGTDMDVWDVQLDCSSSEEIRTKIINRERKLFISVPPTNPDPPITTPSLGREVSGCCCGMVHPLPARFARKRSGLWRSECERSSWPGDLLTSRWLTSFELSVKYLRNFLFKCPSCSSMAGSDREVFSHDQGDIVHSSPF